MNKQSENIRETVWREYREKEVQNEQRLGEIENCEMAFGEVKMRYGISIIGEPDENGYPLYIALHGGGHSDTPTMNDRQWEHMKEYYRDSVKNGIYIAARGVRDTWDTHGNPESFPLYDRLITNMILFKNADPNRIYILGFSAGGDGVYITTPKMADRFASANMSAGCPNGVRLKNLRNMPFIIQAGERDYFFRRNELIAEYDAYLDELAEEYGGFYHEANIHFDKAHNYRDNDPTFAPRAVMKNNAAWLKDGDRTYVEKDTNAISLISKHVRNPYPDKVVWNLSQRGDLRKTDTFYWLGADYSVNEGEVVAKIDRAENTIIIEKATAKAFSVYVNEKIIDFNRDIKIIINAENVITTAPAKIVPSEETTRQTADKNGDINYIFTAKIDFHAV